MKKIWLFALVLTIMWACRTKEESSPMVEAAVTEIQGGEWPRPVSIKEDPMEILKAWPEFMDLQASFESLYTVGNREDLSLVVENLIEKQKLLEKSTYPEEFNLSQIKGRQKVFKTFCLKVKGHLGHDLEIQEPVSQMIEAYNALRNQFNVVFNNKLDKKLLEIDEIDEVVE
ncbi:MAG: hypothetical protein AB3N16_15950 [Flavobacteriaceae bacterium]